MAVTGAWTPFSPALALALQGPVPAFSSPPWKTVLTLFPALRQSPGGHGENGIRAPVLALGSRGWP